MNPKRWVLNGAWALATIATLVAAPAYAQFYEDARRDLDLGPDAISRSPRMLGMGRLSLVLDDVHLRLDIWEFSANPAGLYESDSTSSLEFYPGTTARSTVHDEPAGAGTRVRQDAALREFRNGYETWRRSKGGTAFGVIGEFDRMRFDSPRAGETEVRSQFSMPRTSLVFAGKMPLILPERLRYGFAFTHRYESRQDETRLVVANAAGTYIDKDGTTLPTPESLSPSQYGIRSVGARFGMLLKATSWLNLAGGYDYLGNAIEGRNDAVRNTDEIREDRPYGTFSASAAGRLAGHLAFVGDASRWSTGQTDQRWVASFSTGSGQPPVAGRGLFQRREESGHEYRGRFNWTQNALTLSAGGSSFRREVSTRVPPVGDITSFNYFMNQLSGRPGADSLSLPDSLRSNTTTEEGSEYGVGAALRLPWRSAIAGAEYHASRTAFDQLLSGAVGARKTREFHGGLELPVNAVLQVRGGYIHRWLDSDDEIDMTEYVAQAVTGGFSYMPPRSSWAFDAGYEVRWGRADFGDPTRIRSSEQAGSCRLRWVF
jgi:hypothetical protein